MLSYSAGLIKPNNIFETNVEGINRVNRNVISFTDIIPSLLYYLYPMLPGTMLLIIHLMQKNSIKLWILLLLAHSTANHRNCSVSQIAIFIEYFNIYHRETIVVVTVGLYSSNCEEYSGNGSIESQPRWVLILRVLSYI